VISSKPVSGQSIDVDSSLATSAFPGTYPAFIVQTDLNE
jgi:hypothetical protein